MEHWAIGVTCVFSDLADLSSVFLAARRVIHAGHGVPYLSAEAISPASICLIGRLPWRLERRTHCCQTIAGVEVIEQNWSLEQEVTLIQQFGGIDSLSDTPWTLTYEIFFYLLQCMACGIRLHVGANVDAVPPSSVCCFWLLCFGPEWCFRRFWSGAAVLPRFWLAPISWSAHWVAHRGCAGRSALAQLHTSPQQRPAGSGFC